MKKAVCILAACLLALLPAGCSQAAGQAPQPVDSRESTGASLSMEALANMPPPAGEEADRFGIVEAETPEPLEEPEDAGTDEVIEIEPAFTLEDALALRFDDVPQEDPRAGSIGYAVLRGWLMGADEARFNPDGYVTRAELVTALHRMSGGEVSDTVLIAFSDTDTDSWYTHSVSWAIEAGIAQGEADGTFDPDARVTREQLAVFLYRFAAPETPPAGSLEAWQDGDAIPAYAREGMAWALENRLFAGMVGDVIHPRLPVYRGQLAQVLTALAACREEEPVARELSAAIHFPAAESASQAHHQEIQEKVDATAAKYGAVGLQVAVIEDGRVTDTYAYGWATKGTDRMTPDHKTRIASITKVGVGLAAMALYEDGVIDLDGSIGTYWGVSVKNPYYPSDPVSIRALLTHTSSIPALGDDASRARWAVQDRLQSGGFSRVRPGATSSWIYNNYAYGVLGQTLEIASGKFLDDVMEEHFWEIMEIDGAFESGNVKNKDLLCTVYQYGSVGRSLSAMRSNTRRYSPPGATGAYFSGGMTMSAADLGKMTALLANDGCYEGLQLLKASTVELMEQRCEPQLPDGSWQALSLRSQDGLYGRDRLYYHTGSAYGVFNCMSYDPDTRDGVVVLTSGASGAQDGRGIYAVCGEISRYIYDTIA